MTTTLTITKTKSYNKKHKYKKKNQLHKKFNTHQFNIPIKTNFNNIKNNLKKSINYKNNTIKNNTNLNIINKKFNTHQFNIPIKTTNIKYNTNFNNNNLNTKNLTTNNTTNIYNTSINKNIYINNKYTNNFNKNYINKNLTNTKIINTNLNFINYNKQFNNIQYKKINYKYNYNNTSLKPNTTITILTNNKYLFYPHTNQKSLKNIILIPLTTILKKHIIYINLIISKSNSFNNNSLYHFYIYFNLNTL